MKGRTAMKLHTISRRLAQGLLAGVVVTLTLAIVAQATQTITTPNTATVFYALVAGGVNPGIGMPTNVPVLVMGVQTNPGNRGVGQVTMLSVPTVPGPAFLEWVGLESTAGGGDNPGF